MKVKKAYEIKDAKISFVSLVDKAANLKTFLVTKAEDGKATFTTYGRIVQKDAEHHFVTGVVYEPLAEDAHGNFMTEEEITKAAYYFAKSGSKVDLQHSFEPLDSAAVVESWIAKADFDLGDETVKKGTWLMTVEIDDSEIWGAVEKGEITGFSMGGVGVYGEEDVQLDNVEKTTSGTVNQPEQSETKGLFKRLAKMLGFDVVEKGVVKDKYDKRQRSNSFWTAFNVLQEELCHYDSWVGDTVVESDEAKVKDALADFTAIVEEILLSGEPVTKAIAAPDGVMKAGKKMSGANRETLQTAYDALGALLEAVAEPKPEDEGKTKETGEEGPDGSNDDPEKNPEEEGKKNDKKEDKNVTKAEIQEIVKAAVVEAMAEKGDCNPISKGKDNNKNDDEADKPVTKAEIQTMIEAAVAKALDGDEDEEEEGDNGEAESALTAEAVDAMITKAIEKAVGVPKNLNGSSGVEKQEEHYLHGIL